MHPTVSVALCTHNGAAYIEEQLRSVLTQTRPPSELIISDDASSDDTLDRAQAACGRWGHPATAVRVLRNKVPLGVTSNFAQAVSECTGDLIALCDQDDSWRPDKLALMAARFASQPQLRLAFSGARLVNSAGEPLGVSLFEALEITTNDLELLHTPQGFALLLRRNLITGATTVFRRELLEHTLPFNPEWVHDEWLAIIAAALGEIACLPEPLIDYRQHGSNQIGVVAPTLRYKLQRMLEPRADRNKKLALRSAQLLERLEGEGADPDQLKLVRDKQRFEAARAELPNNRLTRLRPVLALARTGGYKRFASQGRTDIARDLLQPAH